MHKWAQDQYWWQCREYSKNLIIQGQAAARAQRRDLSTEQACCKDLIRKEERLCFSLPQSLSPAGTFHSSSQHNSACGHLRSQLNPRNKGKGENKQTREWMRGDKDAQEEKTQKPYMMLLLTWQITAWTSKNAWWVKHRSVNSTLFLPYQFQYFSATQ